MKTKYKFNALTGNLDLVVSDVVLDGLLKLDQTTPQTLTESPIIDSLTTGRIPFASSTKTLQDSANLFWDSANDRLGLGTPTPSSMVDILAPAVASTREAIFRAKVSDGGDSAFFIYNATFHDNRFIPAFAGYSNTSGAVPLVFTSFVGSTADTGTSGAMVFNSRRTSSAIDPINGTNSDITTMPLFEWRGNNTTNMLMDAAGKVGIGTTTPDEILDVNGNIKATGYKTGAETGVTTTQTVVTDVRDNDGVIEKKTQVLTFTNGLLTTQGAESDWA